MGAAVVGAAVVGPAVVGAAVVDAAVVLVAAGSSSAQAATTSANEKRSAIKAPRFLKAENILRNPFVACTRAHRSGEHFIV